jgi:type IV pilus assembly protein PilQ
VSPEPAPAVCPVVFGGKIPGKLISFLNNCAYDSSKMKTLAILVRTTAVAVLLVLSACQHSMEKSAQTSKTAKPAPRVTTTSRPAAAASVRAKAPPPANHNAKINEILALAKQDKWAEAETEASTLYALDPKNLAVQRVYNWVKTEGPKRQEKRTEDEIRDVTSKESRFNPTIKSLLTDKKNKGLPPRSDLREAIEQIKSTPYIPENFGKTIEAKGTLNDLDSRPSRMDAILEKEISVRLDNVTLEAIIFNIGQAEGINFVADKSLAAFQQKLSLNFKNVKLAEFLRFVSRNLDVQFQVGEDLIWILDGKDPKKLFEETRYYRLKRGFIIPAQFGISDAVKTTVTAADKSTTVTETQKFENFVRDGAPKTPSIEAALKQFFEGSKYYIDYERNLIVARGTHEQLRLVEKLIEEFDRPMQQVFIEARFITVTEPAFLQLGMAWDTQGGPSAPRSVADFTGLAATAGTAQAPIVSPGLDVSWKGILNQTNLTATLTAIEQSGESETLSAPRITVVNNLPSTISDGKVQYYYEEYTVTQQILQYASSSRVSPLGKPAKLNSGVSLDVLASIGGDGNSILLALKPEVVQDVQMVNFATMNDRDETGKLVSSFDIKLPVMRTQTLATRVVVKSGQTVVMGGVLEREQRTFVESVPILSSIPLIGAAFRRRTEIDQPRYLLVFVTATLLSESGQFIVSPDPE